MKVHPKKVHPKKLHPIAVQLMTIQSMMSKMVPLNLWQLQKRFKTRVPKAVQTKLEKRSNHPPRQPPFKRLHQMLRCKNHGKSVSSQASVHRAFNN